MVSDAERRLLQVLRDRPDVIDPSEPDAEALALACAATVGEPMPRPSALGGVPRLLHQLWIGPRQPPRGAIETWRRHHPDWEHILWREDDLRSALPRHVYDHAMSHREICGRADIFRYHLLARYGGVFLDADAVCLRRLPEELGTFDFWTCFEAEDVRPGLLALGYMACAPSHPAMVDLANRVSAMDLPWASSRYRAWEFVGNQLLTNVVRLLPPRSVAILPSRCFIGTHHTGTPSPGAWPQFAEQRWGSTKGYDHAGL